MSVEEKVLEKLKSKPWTSNEEFELMFPKGVKGHYSWPQRLRSLREAKHGGYTLNRRVKEGTKNLSEWHLELPEPPKTEIEQIISDNNLAQETQINLKEVNKQMEMSI